MKSSFCLAIAVLMAVSINGLAKEQAIPNPYKDQLSNVKPLDLPLQCASLVARADKLDQEKTTVWVVDAAVAARPTSVMAVVAAIAKSTPEMAAIAAARGAALVPNYAPAIAKAAASAVPLEAGRIAYSVCRSLPQQYSAIALAVGSASPALGSEILGAITLAIPELKPFIMNAAAQARGNDSTLPNVLTLAAKATGSPSLAALSATSPGPSAMPVLPPPRVGLPFVPLTGTPTETNPGQSGEVPPDYDRDYASP